MLPTTYVSQICEAELLEAASSLSYMTVAWLGGLARAT